MAARDENRSPDAIAAWARFVRVSQDLLARVEADIKAAGFPPLAWYDALLELRRAGRKGLRPFELQREMLLAQYSISRLVERLIEAGYATRRPAPDDGRGQVLTITAEGRGLLRQMWPAYRRAMSRHFSGKLDDPDVAALSRILDRLRA